MRKFLSIIIPRYKESELEIFSLLASIRGQVGIDFNDLEIFIVNDGPDSKELDNNFIKLFGLPIVQINREVNGGPGAARQTGLDFAKGEYVLFCDADDTLHNVGVLGALMQEADKTAVDILSSDWLEEIVTDNGHVYITHNIESTWMHGKLIRRQFLLQHNIRFHDSLRVHEDSYFLAIASSLTERRNHLPTVTYVWKYNADSITRRNGAIYTFNSHSDFIIACTLAHKEVEKMNPAIMHQKIVQFVLYNYFYLHLPGWLDEKNTELLKEAEDTFVKEIASFWHYWKEADPKMINDLYNQERSKSFNGLIESETLDAWFTRLNL